jgi:hypothetical protein
MEKQRPVAHVERGSPHDDAIVSLQYDHYAVAVIKSLPATARQWHPASRTWTIHPAFIDGLAAALWRIGFQIVEHDLDRRSG